MTAFIKSVEYVEITLEGGSPTSANLTKSQTIANCVPIIAGLTVKGNALTAARRCPEIYFESGPKVTADRVDATVHATTDITVGIFVVEFDTSGDVSVQQGTFTIADTATNTTETITSVTTTKAFCLIARSADSTSANVNNERVAVSFNSSTELSFDRSGSSGAINGRYYVVSTSGTDFSVEHATLSIVSTDETTTTTITSVDTSKTFLLTTNLSPESGVVRDMGMVTDLQNATTIRMRRAFDSFGGSPGTANGTATIEVQVVEAGGTEFSVERAECDWGDSATNAVTVTEIDQAQAIVIPGCFEGWMSSTETSAADVDGNIAILDFTSDTEVTGTREINTDPDGTTFFEVVEFVLAGAAGAAPVFLYHHRHHNKAA